MKATSCLVLLQFCLMSCLLPAGQESLLIFHGMQGQPLSEAEGMNVAHQVLTGLIQKAAPILVSIDVWNHMLQRRDRCKIALTQKDSLHAKVNQLVQQVRKMVASKVVLADINTQLGATWYQQQYPTLAVLDGDKNKEVMFDYFCMQVDDLVAPWTAYRLHDAYVLLLPEDVRSLFNLRKAQALAPSELLVPYKNPQFMSLASVLLGLLKDKKISWSFYLTGHGHHAGPSQPESMIAGMTIVQFQSFLKFLNDHIATTILVYSSCFSSGMHLVDPYIATENVSLSQDLNIELRLNFPVVVTCLTDAPVYVFGMPSGLKLPPYDQSFRLEQSDVDQGKLNWCLMQNFTNFVRAASTKKSLKDVAQSVMMYQECRKQICNLAKLENIPLVRRPGMTFFVPIDTTYVEFVIHNEKQIKNVDGKYGLLWYIKQYDGTIYFKNRIAQCISMVPGDGAVWMHRVQALDFGLSDIVQQAFFSVEDMHGVRMFLCDELVCKDIDTSKETLYKFMALPKSSWVPKELSAGDGGICCYLKGKDGYGVAVTKSGAMGKPYKLSAAQQQAAWQLWLLLRQESKLQQDLSADQLWSQSALRHRQQQHALILTRCP